MNIIRKPQSPAEMWKAHVLARLKDPDCWMCVQAAQELERDFFWFVNEQYYESKMVDRMRLAQGFCVEHTRYFLRNAGNAVITTVFAYVAWYLIDRLRAARRELAHDTSGDTRERCRRAAALLRPQTICPMCASLQASEKINIHAFIHALDLVDVRAGYEESSGLCLPHFRQTAADAPWNTLAWLTADMRERLKVRLDLERSPLALLEQAVGQDKESQLRANGSRRPAEQAAAKMDSKAAGNLELAQADGHWSPNFEQALAALSEPGCPVCRACEQGTQQYLGWLAQQMEGPETVSDSWEATFNVCDSHLWELYAGEREQAAMKIGRHVIQQWLARFDQLTSELKKKSSARWSERLRDALFVACGADDPPLCHDLDYPLSRRKKVKAVLESREHRLDRLREIAFREDLCQACAQIRTTSRRLLDLILRVLEDSHGRKVFHESAGICLRHCLEAAELAEVPEALDELLAAQIARLRVIQWELDEATRKSSWSLRYESKGAEQDAWRRAATQLYGI